MKWLKEHPRIVAAIGTSIVTAASAYGVAPEPTMRVLKLLAALLGFL